LFGTNVALRNVGLSVVIAILDRVLAVVCGADYAVIPAAAASPVTLDPLSNAEGGPCASHGGRLADAGGWDSGFPGSIIVCNRVSGGAGASSHASGVPAAKSSPVAGDGGASADRASGLSCRADEDRVHVGVGVTVIVSDVVTALRVDSGDLAGEPPAISTVVAHDSLSKSESH